MEKPFWLKLAMAILGICLYTGDTIGEVLVGLDLIQRCHYFYAASIFSFAIMPGFVFAFCLICILNFDNKCSLKILWLLLAPLGGALAGIAFIPGGLVMLILLAMVEVHSSERSELVEVKE